MISVSSKGFPTWGSQCHELLPTFLIPPWNWTGFLILFLKKFLVGLLELSLVVMCRGSSLVAVGRFLIAVDSRVKPRL